MFRLRAEKGDNLLWQERESLTAAYFCCTDELSIILSHAIILPYSFLLNPQFNVIDYLT